MRFRPLVVALPFFAAAACGSTEPDTPRGVVADVTTTVRVTTTAPPASVAPATAAPTTAPPATAAPTTRVAVTSPPATSPAVTPVFYANCAAVRAAGKAPIRRGEPGYSSSLDRDGDGIACET